MQGPRARGADEVPIAGATQVAGRTHPHGAVRPAGGVEISGALVGKCSEASSREGGFVLDG